MKRQIGNCFVRNEITCPIIIVISFKAVYQIRKIPTNQDYVTIIKMVVFFIDEIFTML